MITFHFHLQPQYRYELFHINFTSEPYTKIYRIDALMGVSVYLLSTTWKWQQDFLSQRFIHKTELQQLPIKLAGFLLHSIRVWSSVNSSRRLLCSVFFFILPSAFCSIAWIPFLVNIRWKTYVQIKIKKTLWWFYEGLKQKHSLFVCLIIRSTLTPAHNVNWINKNWCLLNISSGNAWYSPVVLFINFITRA